MYLPDSPQVDDQHWFEKHVEVLFLLVLFTESLSAPEDEAVEGFDSSRLIRRFALLDGDVEADIGDGVVESTESFFLMNLSDLGRRLAASTKNFRGEKAGREGVCGQAPYARV